MSIDWQRRGCIFAPDNHRPWMTSHASNPFAEPLPGGSLRVYFSSRDSHQRSSIGSVVVDVDDLGLSELTDEPWVTYGERGAFDDSGVSIGCIVDYGDDRYLYYVGWCLSVTVPFRNSIGLAISQGGGPFERVSRAPILDRSSVDPFNLSYPWVLRDQEGWQMWYGSTLSWDDPAGEPGVGVHAIRHASSKDGICWIPSNVECVGPSAGFPSAAYSRPCVYREDDGYRMWFSERRAQYCIGSAVSRDGIEWQPAEEVLLPSTASWENEATAYSHVFRWRDRLHAVYCGNGYGRSGFGLAVESDPQCQLHAP